MKEIVLRFVNDDWMELLIDGQIEMDGHDLPLSEVIKTVKAPKVKFRTEDVEQCIYCETRLDDEDQDRDGYKCGKCIREMKAEAAKL